MARNHSDSREFFDARAEEFAGQYGSRREFSERRSAWVRRIERHLDGRPAEALCLDVGCGDGVLSREVAARGHRCIGFDQAPAMVALARRRAAETELDGLLEYHARTLPFFDPSLEGRAQLVICSSVLEYVEDIPGTVRSFFSFLAPGGVALVSVPNWAARYRRVERLLRRAPALHPQYLRHQRYLGSVATTRRLFELGGFACTDLDFFARPPLGWLFGRRDGEAVSTMALLVFERR